VCGEEAAATGQRARGRGRVVLLVQRGALAGRGEEGGARAVWGVDGEKGGGTGAGAGAGAGAAPAQLERVLARKLRRAPPRPCSRSPSACSS
jgi:hypothetical protein